MLKQSKETVVYAGIFTFISTVGLDLVITLLVFLLWKRTAGQKKKLFALFCVSFALLAIADFNYTLTVDILGITNYSGAAASLFRIPFTGFLIFQLLGWGIIFLKSKPHQNDRTFFISYLPVALTILIIFTIFLLSNITWKVQVSSLFKLYCLSDTIFQTTGFVFALLCLAITTNKQIRFITTGFLIIITDVFFAISSHITQNLLPVAWTENMWFAGLLLITFGFSNMLKKPSDLKTDRWLNSLNSVQAQCAFWSFVICMSSLIIFSGISYLLIGRDLLEVFPLQYLPSVLIAFSVFAVLISSILARVLSAPFERVRSIIDTYLNGKNFDTVHGKHGRNIYEFELLESFLTKSFEVLGEKNKAQQELFNCANQVAHDIRSPLTSLNMVSKILPELPEEKRILIRNAAQRINDIANNLLVKYKVDKEVGAETHLKAELVSSLLDHLVSEKRFQMAEKSIELILDLGNNTHGCFVNLESGKLKRVISNLINNASEAIDAKGIIRLTLEKELDTLAIKIIDNGKGIPQDILPKIKQGEISVGKKEGFGLGIFGAIQNIKKWKGTYEIQSKEGEGTTFIIRLPITEAPGWFQFQINITQGMNVIVLDDDQSIHDVWETRFQEYIKNGKIVLEHFYTPSTFIESCQSLSSTKTLFLIDYELLGSEETGLDLIEKLELKDHAILVTSRYEEPAIRAKIINLGIKTIPKNFAPYILIEFSISL